MRRPRLYRSNIMCVQHKIFEHDWCLIRRSRRRCASLKVHYLVNSGRGRRVTGWLLLRATATTTPRGYKRLQREPRLHPLLRKRKLLRQRSAEVPNRYSQRRVFCWDTNREQHIYALSSLSRAETYPQRPVDTRNTDIAVNPRRPTQRRSPLNSS